MTRDQKTGNRIAAPTQPGRTVWMVRIGSRGRVTLPLAIRKRFELKPGDVINFRIADSGVRMEMPSRHATDRASRTGHTAAKPPTDD